MRALCCDAAGGACVALASGTTQGLRAVWASDANNIYVAGDGGTVLRCSVGLNACSSLTVNTTQLFHSIWGIDGNNVYIVGGGGSVRRCAAGSTTCTELNSGVSQNLLSVWGSDTSNVYVAGDGGYGATVHGQLKQLHQADFRVDGGSPLGLGKRCQQRLRGG